MKCQFCKQEFEEKDIQESHDVPCYLFIRNGNRKGQKNAADKCGRHWLCNECHENYEQNLNSQLKILAHNFSRGWFSYDTKRIKKL